ncbi:MAG: [Clostridia bacterium]|nr:[FeFe] hydrogenase H-cluster maturation GTPase HydF [Clostridia bacterium]
MSLNETVSAERIHIGFFGKRNAGKSSLVNAVTNQDVSLVSDVKGTTTDPVTKAMEILPLGPVLITDTPGIDDEGTLGAMRADRAKKVLAKTDVAILAADINMPLSDEDRELIEYFIINKVPYIIARTKSDLKTGEAALGENEIAVSSVTLEGIEALKNKIGEFAKKTQKEKYVVSDLLDEGSLVMLVIPIDSSAPKGRIILPQQQVLRELLDKHISVICCQPEEIKGTLSSLGKAPDLVITDSQAFEKVAADVPETIPLTSFSILFARYKGDIDVLAAGAKALSQIKDGDRILISEGCTHHRQCEDIGTVKIPAMIKKYTGVQPVFEFTSGGGFPDDLSPYSLIVHCGGCMLSEKEMKNRLAKAQTAGIPAVNYGVLIAYIKGILDRSLSPFA